MKTNKKEPIIPNVYSDHAGRYVWQFEYDKLTDEEKGLFHIIKRNTPEYQKFMDTLELP